MTNTNSDDFVFSLSDSNAFLTIWDNEKRAKKVITIFSLIIILTIITLYFRIDEFIYLKDIYTNKESINKNAMNSDILIGLYYINWAFLILSLIIFISWFRRAYGNLHRIGINNNKMKHIEPMALWAWFIPFLNLYLPPVLMNEIVCKTQENIKSFDDSYKKKNLSSLIIIWWVIWITFRLLFLIYLRFQETITSSQEGLITYSKYLIIQDVSIIVDGLIIILLVYKVSRIESYLKKTLKSNGGTILIR